MALSAGTRLGPYEIVAPIGAGGMGEVYRARDTRLDRTVAIKVLSSTLSASPDLKARFEREARAISQLQHPHICVLHDVGSESGTDYLVMEYLEGESLAERLKKGALPLDQTMRIAIEIADALDKAHRAGIVHRDLKPANVMLTKAGAKLLDFGLAKPLSVPGATTAAPLLSATMTMSGPSPQSPLTTAGSIVGTVQYMSPEQLQGREADARADIFALGAMLYEMVTGNRAFDGKSQISVASAILEKEPEPITHSQPLAPAALEHVIRRALAKDPDERWQTAVDVKGELQWVSQAPPQAAPLPGRTRASTRERLLWGAALMLVALAAAVPALLPRGFKYERAIVSSIAPPAGASFAFTGNAGGAVEVSPDGSRLAFLAIGSDGKAQVWVRDLAQPEGQPLAGTENAGKPFWSPDSRSLGFFADGKLKRIDVGGGPAVTLCDARNARGGTWAPSGVIVFTPDTQAPILSVPENGGHAQPVTQLERSRHSTHRWPYALPDGKHFLYLAANHREPSGEQNGIYWASLDGKENKLLIRSIASAAYASGWLLFMRENSLMAQPFDPARGTLKDEPVAIVEHVPYDAGVWRGVFSASQNGILAFQAGGTTALGAQLEWRERAGGAGGSWGKKEAYSGFAISHDGMRLATNVGDPARDLWINDFARSVRSRLTFQPAQIFGPVWSPDDDRVAFASDATGTYVLYTKAASGAGEETRLYEIGPAATPTDWSSDGKYIVFNVMTQATGRDLWVFATATKQAQALLNGPGDENQGVLSPDGRWLAYASNESGHAETYVTPFPHVGAKWQISSEGGSLPAWSRDGRELYYLRPDNTLMATAVNGGGAGFQPGAVTPLFRLDVAPGVTPLYRVMPEGKRFLVTGGGKSTEMSSLTLISNWNALLKK